MEDEMKMGCYRYFLIPYDQITVFQMQIKDRKSLMESLLVSNETSLKISENYNEEKYKLYLVSKLNDDNYILQFGKHSSITQSEDTGDHFKEHVLDNHPYIQVFINTKEQIVLFEKKTIAFRDFIASANAFSKYINVRVDSHGYEFRLEEIQSSNRFWSLIESAKSIESISLLLYSPNLFDGSTPAEESVKDFEAATNSTENILTFKNRHGKLKLSREKLDTYIDYISCGGGNWILKAIVPNETKTKFSSKDKTKVIDFPRSDDGSKKSLLKKLENVINNLKTKPGDVKNNEESNKK